MKKISSLLFSVLFLVLLVPLAWAAQNQSVDPTSQDQSVEQASKNKGYTVYKDASGGTCIDFYYLPSLSAEEQSKQLKFLKEHQDIIEGVAKEAGKIHTTTFGATNYYDVENNPVLISKSWNEDDCGPNAWTTYARHTLGTVSDTSSGKYLLSFGDCSRFMKGRTALPYRNGASDFPKQRVIDVAKGSWFDVRHIANNKAAHVQVNDFGPNQCPGSAYVKRIVDLNNDTFYSLNNNKDGLFYCRTWVPLKNYFPAS